MFVQRSEFNSGLRTAVYKNYLLSLLLLVTTAGEIKDLLVNVINFSLYVFALKVAVTRRIYF